MSRQADRTNTAKLKLIVDEMRPEDEVASLQLGNPSVRFFRDGEATLRQKGVGGGSDGLTRNKKYVLFLFNELLIVTTNYRNLIGKNRYKIMEKIRLNEVSDAAALDGKMDALVEGK